MPPYTYDANSNTATVIYANNYKSTYTYDSGNRTTQQKVENTTPSTLVAWAFCPRTSRAHTQVRPYSPAGLPSNTFGYSRTDSQTTRSYLIAFDRLNRIKLEKMTESVYTRYQYEHSRRYPKLSSFGFHERDARAPFLSNYTATVTTDANGNIVEIEDRRQEWRRYKNMSGEPLKL